MSVHTIHEMKDLRRKTIRSGLWKLIGQLLNLILRLVFLVVMARLLDPKDFGLVAMVTAVTGVFGLFTWGGFSYATIQQAVITDEQISTLFWINVLIGALLACLCMATAPVLVDFYGDPRLFWVTIASAGGLLLTAATVLHMALIERQLRFGKLAVVEIFSQFVGIAVGIGTAFAGFGYWSLVISTLLQAAILLIGVWVIEPWRPGPPRRNVRIFPLLRFGGTVTLYTFVTYLSSNLDKILLGRFWGADVLGRYGRGYQLINIPTQNLNGAIGGVAFAALVRLQRDPIRLKSYFLKYYTLMNSLTLPTTLFCAVFANDIIAVVLGPKWIDTIPIFRLLTPTVLIFGIVNPVGWLLLAIGLQTRNLKIALVIAPSAAAAYVIGLPFGPEGVALAYSTAMLFWLVPQIIWSLHGTPISLGDIFWATGKPFFSALLATAAALVVAFYAANMHSPLLRLALESFTMFAVYYGILLFVMGEKTLYVYLFRALRAPTSSAADSLAVDGFKTQ